LTPESSHVSSFKNTFLEGKEDEGKKVSYEILLTDITNVKLSHMYMHHEHKHIGKRESGVQGQLSL
jgi:hypothetical protein